jgi:hypothetical protein
VVVTQKEKMFAAQAVEQCQFKGGLKILSDGDERRKKR